MTWEREKVRNLMRAIFLVEDALALLELSFVGDGHSESVMLIQGELKVKKISDCGRELKYENFFYYYRALVFI